MNGISDEQFLHNRNSIWCLESFFSDCPSLYTFQHFPNLRELRIISQDLDSLSGLEECPSLERLWVVECEIAEIQYIGELRNLKYLNLSSNAISQISGLDLLDKLEVLWLNKNQISVLEGIQCLTSLQTLWLGSNQIRTLQGVQFPAAKSLREINLADNLLIGFHEIQILTDISSLRVLWFDDPHFGPNPMCSLANYQTQVLVALPELEELDCVEITAETKQIAHSTFIKKKMYYNMRIKTIKRSTSAAGKSAARARKQRTAVVLSVLESLICAQYEVTKRIQDLRNNQCSEDEIGPLESLQENIAEKVQMTHEILEGIHDMYKSLSRKLCIFAEEETQRMLIELENGGNIRFDEATVNSPYFETCLELIQSRFTSPDFESFGFNNVRVIRISKLHNRCLRNQFEEAVEAEMEDADDDIKPYVEYLICAPIPGAAEDIIGISEVGYPTVDQMRKANLDGAIPCSSSLFALEQKRIQHILGDHSSLLTKADVSGQLLICRVFTGENCLETERSVPVGSVVPDPPHWTLDFALMGRPTKPAITEEGFEDVHSVSRMHADGKRKIVFVLDNKLVLPEYIVDIDYAESADDDLPYDDLDGVSAENAVMLRYFLRRFATELQTLTAAVTPAAVKDLILPTTVWRLKAEERLQRLTPKVLQSVCGTTSLSTLTHLNLHNQLLSRMECLDEVPYLTDLTLSFNCISKIEGLTSCTRLKYINLSHNAISRIEGLKYTSHLTTFLLAFNQISRVEDSLALKKYNTALRELDLSYNPVVESKGYRKLFIRRNASLRLLDGRDVTLEEKSNASASSSIITAELIMSCASASARSGAERRRTRSVSAREKFVEELANKGAHWWSEVDSLDLSHQHLRRIQNLEKLANLKRLVLYDNEITVIDGLAELKLLEELVLEENQITSIHGLESCVRLQKLELGFNHITAMDGILTLTNLTMLSLEDNRIEHLLDLSPLENLLELYMANNRVQSAKEVGTLKANKKLIILDLSGNPVVEDPDYRLYTVYNIQKLKVLDGKGVDSSEISKAKEMYTGRLLAEQVEQILRGRDANRVEGLDLSALKLRDVGVLETFSLLGLKDLRLEDNLLSGIGSSLSNMHALRRLTLSHNRLDIGSKKESFVGLKYVSPSLELLDLSFCSLSSIPSLQIGHLVNLHMLLLNDNEIQNVEGLDNLTSLRELRLNKNRIRHIDSGSFLRMPHMRELHLEENLLRSLLHVGPFANLKKLFLDHNRVTETFELDRMPFMETVVAVTIRNNPVTRKPNVRLNLIRRFPNVAGIDGKEVSPEEREKAMQIGQADSNGNSFALGSVGNAGSSSAPPGTKVPVKLASVNFDTQRGMEMMLSDKSHGTHGTGRSGAGHSVGAVQPVKVDLDWVTSLNIGNALRQGRAHPLGGAHLSSVPKRATGGYTIGKELSRKKR